MKSSCYVVFSPSVLLCPNLYSINPHNPLRTRSILVLIFVWLTHGFSAMTDCKRPSLSPINFRHVHHRKHLLFYTCLQFCCLALSMARTTLKTSHVIDISLVHWCAPGNLFTNPLPSNGCTCNNIRMDLR
jgi:hypothetical protein